MVLPAPLAMWTVSYTVLMKFGGMDLVANLQSTMSYSQAASQERHCSIRSIRLEKGS